MPRVKVPEKPTPRVLGLPRIRESPGFEYNGRVYVSRELAEEARAQELVGDLIDEFTYEGEFALEDLCHHLRENPADREEFIRYISPQSSESKS
jgi:hypothetical protein